MLLNDRQTQIVEELRLTGSVDVETLTTQFGVTSQTVRRDLSQLCNRGLAMRTHGGARRLVSTSSLDYEERRLEQQSQKSKIGTVAAALIPDNCSLILNIGTTTEQVARALTDHKNLTVLSNNINVIQIFRESNLRELVLVGGSVRPSDGAIVGNEAVKFISNYKVDYAIIGASCLDPDGSILDFDAREVAVARTILSNARTSVLVADTSKFECRAPVRICTLADLDYVILDRLPPPEFTEIADRDQCQILTDVSDL